MSNGSSYVWGDILYRSPKRIARGVTVLLVVSARPSGKVGETLSEFAISEVESWVVRVKQDVDVVKGKWGDVGAGVH